MGRPIRRAVVGAAIAAIAVTGLSFTASAQMQERTLRVGINSVPPDLGNLFKAIGSPASYTFSAIFDSLTFVGDPRGPQPSLASAWKNVDDTTWRFQIRSGIKFANGEPFNADAVVATVNWLLSDDGKKFGNRAGFELKNMAGATRGHRRAPFDVWEAVNWIE